MMTKGKGCFRDNKYDWKDRHENPNSEERNNDNRIWKKKSLLTADKIWLVP
jgi:hypothetical protein